MASPVPGSDCERFADTLRWLLSHRLLSAYPILLREGLVGHDWPGSIEPMVARVQEKDAWRAEWENEVFALFQDAGIPVLCLKGAALGRWLYDRPEQRSRVDLDLLVAPADRDRAEKVLFDAGYRPMPATVSTTQAAWHRNDGSGKLIDLHWCLSDQPVFHHAFPFQGLWSESVAIDPATPQVRRLDAVHSLVHAIVHFYGSDPKHERPRIWLLDIVLLDNHLDDGDRVRFERICFSKGISGLAAVALDESFHSFGREPDRSLINRLGQAGTRQWQTALARGPRSRFTNLYLGLRAQPGLSGKLAFLRSIAFPPAEYMHRRYPKGSRLGLLGLYGRRFLGV